MELILKEQTFKNISIVNSTELFNKIQKIKGIDYFQENLIVFYLNSKNVLIGYEVLFKGGLNSCVVDPKIIYRKALLKRANSLIIAHNHPSKDLTPSNEDITIAKAIKKAGDMLDLKLIDFIIFNKTQYYSFDVKNLLN